MPPKVSVIIPTYNYADSIHETLDGVLQQSFQDFEVIVVDDGSSDDPGAVVSRYDSRFHYLRQSNQGPAAARNAGVRKATGDFIAFLDHDDVWNELHLEKLLDCFARHPNAAMVFDDAEYFGVDAAPGTSHVDEKVANSMLDTPVPIRRIWQCWVASMSVVMIKKTTFDALGGLNPKIWGLDDLHFYLRLAAGAEVRFIGYVGCRKRLTPNNLLPQVGLKGSVDCLEELQRNHPEVVRAIGPMKYRRRLGRKQHKLGVTYLRRGDVQAARPVLWKAYRHNAFNLKYLWRFIQSTQRSDRVAYGK